MLKEVWQFFKYPENIILDASSYEKKQRFLRLLLFTVIFSILSGILLELLSALFDLDFGTHAAEQLLEQFSATAIFFLAVILAPLLEEFFFRGPLVFFKNPTTFKYAFYASILLFGLVHISNFEDLNGHYWAVPFLVLPQLCAGVFLGFIRVRQGLISSILLHAAHNLVLVGPIIVFKLFDIPLP